ncbi:NAD(P)H-binding protein [Nocardiopsis sediminis]|uniref:NAD(P)H-binding protein n=1 Tax=Nocardiopsis sediminis TaxID=1778267 RepID=A0ABV8FN82_9ACTN
MTTLVTGATGNIGRLVVERLTAAGEEVRALTRAPVNAAFSAGVRVVAGDLAAPATLGPALAGVDRMFLFPVAATAAEVAGLAAAAGVRRVVVLSSGAVTGGLDTDFHLPVEQAVEAAVPEWTHVRPGEFALNKVALWGPSIRAENVVRDPFPDAAWFPVHEADIADVACAALLEGGHAGAAYTLNGPELLSHREQVAAIGAAIGREIAHEQVTPEQAREIYRAMGGFAGEAADFLLGFEDYGGAETTPEEVAASDPAALGPQPTAEQVTGRPARTFAQWARDHAADFR